MYTVLEKNTLTEIDGRYKFATLSEAKAHATRWQATNEHCTYSVLSDGVKIWSTKGGDDKNIMFL